jgi:hypothetical protein
VGKILIIAARNDTHLSAVNWGLTKLGNAPTIWHWEDFPKKDSASLWMGQDGTDRFSLNNREFNHVEPFDVIWVRRRGEPQAMAGSHPDDLPVIEKESSLFLDNILPMIGHSETRWINHPHADERAKSKGHQLQAARMLGFLIPDTLMGNDIAAVRKFFTDHPGGIVHKSFYPHGWNNEDGSRTNNCTAAISAAQLEHSFPIQACPSIYQAKIEKKHELRVTAMGDSILASQIDSQRDGPTIDWRHEGGLGHDNLTYTELSKDVADRCRALCRQLDLAFGCIDLIVTPEDEIVFLEINRIGQFLFNEVADPNIPMLDTFCRFLIGGAPGTVEDTIPRLRFAEFLASDV